MVKQLLVIYLFSFTYLFGQKGININQQLAFTQLEEAFSLAPTTADSAEVLFITALTYYKEKQLLGDFYGRSKKPLRQLYQSGNYPIAIKWLEIISNAYANDFGKDASTIYDIRFEIARAYYFGKKHAICLDVIQQSRALDSAKIDSLAIANMLNLEGAALRNLDNYEGAIAAYKRALEIRIKVLGEKHNLVASIYYNIGFAYHEQRIINKAINYYQKARIIRTQLLGPDHINLMKLYNNEANLYGDLGQNEKAIVQVSKAIEILEKNTNEPTEQLGRLYLNLGVAYKATSAFVEAEGYFNQALKVFKSLPTVSPTSSKVYFNLGNLYRERQQPMRAIESHQKALKLYQEMADADQGDIADVYTNLGVAYLSLATFDKGLKFFSNALGIYKKIENYEDVANTYNNIGDVYFRMQKLERAKLFQDSALHIQAELFDQKHPAIAYTYNKLSEIALAQNGHQLALAYIQKALIANHQTFGDTDPAVSPSSNGYLRYDYFFEALLLKADILQQSFSKDREKLQLAQQQYHIADSILSRLRNELTSKADKINLAQKVQQLSKLAITNAWQLAAMTGQKSYWDEAFYFAEKSKANVLLQSISANNAKQFAGIPDSLLALEEQLQSDINYYSLQLVDRPDSTKIPLFQAELFEARQMHKKLISRFEEDFPIYYELKYASQIPRVKAVQFGLPEKTAMVSYFTGDSVLYAFYVGKNDYQVFSTPLNVKAFSKRVNAFTKGAKSTSQSLGRVFVSTGQALYQQVFPFPIPENIKQLVIIPDGQLTKIPFEALLTTEVESKAAIDFSTLPYLINDFDISYTPSASLYYQSQTNTQQNTYANNTELVAFAPVFSNEEPLALSTQRFLENSGDQERAFTKDGTYISPLPGTAIELEAISQVFADKNLSTTNFTYQQATEAQIKSKLVQKCRYLHIATHGFINEDYPDLSGLLFATDTSSLENAILAAGEVYGLQLKANLVVLSACETGKGKITSGEGVLGLSRAFLYAGAENLIVSLWKVDDRATAELMAAFYKTHLKKTVERLPFKEALRQAKLQLIQSKEFSQPYYWSAFVLIGE